MNPLVSFLRRWSIFLGAVAVWELVTRLADDPFFPPPTQIASTALDLWFSGPASSLFLTDAVFDHILPSLGRVFGGWALAVVLGVALGTALGRSRVAMDYAGPLLAFLRAIPPPALVPVFLVLFGLTSTMRTFLIVFGVIWPILLNTVDGVRSVSTTQHETARSFRTPRHYWLFLVVLPAAMPKIFAGLRLSMSLALILMVVSEMIGSTDGIGFQLVFNQVQFELPSMWAWIALLGVLGYLLNALLLVIERRMLGWQPSSSGTPTAKAGVSRGA